MRCRAHRRSQKSRSLRADKGRKSSSAVGNWSSHQSMQGHTLGHVLFVDVNLRFVILEFARRGIGPERVNLDPFEQLVGRGVAELGIVFKYVQPARAHEAAS